LDQRQCERQHQRVVTKFGDHVDGSEFTSGVSPLTLDLP
jgi:hypothetical protein